MFPLFPADVPVILHIPADVPIVLHIPADVSVITHIPRDFPFNPITIPADVAMIFKLDNVTYFGIRITC